MDINYSVVIRTMGKAKEAMRGTLIGTVIRTLTLFILCFSKIGLWALIWATGINMIIVTIHQYKHVKKALEI